MAFSHAPRLVPLVAGLDLGTNNCRLLIARPMGSANHFRAVDTFSRIVRLGEGVGQTGFITPEAEARTLEALKICADRLNRFAPTRVRAVATAACRHARNGRDFLERARAQTGIPLEVISAEEEAFLALHGCAPLLEPEYRHGLLFDIGGGSTEFIWLRHRAGQSPEILSSISFPFGVVTLSEEWRGQPFAYGDMVKELGRRIQAIHAQAPVELDPASVQLIGCSGSVTTLAGVIFGLTRYQRSRVDGQWLDVQDIRVGAARIAAMTEAERAHQPCIGPERADLVVAGCAMIEAILSHLPARRMRVADRGVREGIVTQLIRQMS